MVFNLKNKIKILISILLALGFVSKCQIQNKRHRRHINPAWLARRYTHTNSKPRAPQSKYSNVILWFKSILNNHFQLSPKSIKAALKTRLRPGAVGVKGAAGRCRFGG